MEEFDKSFKLTKSALILSGVDIENGKNKSWYSIMTFVFYVNLAWLYTDVLGELFWLIEGIQEEKSFGELSFIAPCTTICLLSTAKSAPLYYSRQIIANVLEKLRQMQPKFEESDYSGEDSSKKVVNKAFDDEYRVIDAESKETEKKIVKDTFKYLNGVILLLYYSFGLVIVAFTMLPAAVMTYDYYKRGEFELVLPFLVKYFFDPFTKINYPLVYIHQVWSTFIVGFNVFGADSFISAFCFYIRMHFQILCHRFEHVVVPSKVVTKQRLTSLIKDHQELIELVNQVETVCSKGILFNMVTSSVLICLSGFNVTFLEEAGAVFAFFTFLVMSLSQISLLCLFGDMLLRSSIQVNDAICKCRWYDTDSDIKKIVLIILIRSQKPCKLTAAKFADLNLSAFTTILSRSWSYFALLRTVYK